MLRIGLEHDRLAGAAGEWRYGLPDFLGDERHQRMQQAQITFEHFEERTASAALLRFRRAVGLQRGLAELEIPVAVLVPRELVERLRGEIEAVFGELTAHLCGRRAQP